MFSKLRRRRLDTLRQFRQCTSIVGMGRKMMSGKKASPKDSDLASVEKALKRAAKTARSLARKTHTPCYVVKDGKIVNVAERQTEYLPPRQKPSR